MYIHVHEQTCVNVFKIKLNISFFPVKLRHADLMKVDHTILF